MYLVPRRLAAFAAVIILLSRNVHGVPIDRTSPLPDEAGDSKAFATNDVTPVIAAAALANDPLADALQNKLSILNKQLTKTAQPKPTTVTSSGLYVFLQTIKIKNVKPALSTAKATPTVTPLRNPKQPLRAE